MATTPPVADLVQAIETHDMSAIAQIEALSDRCLVDERNRTLFDVAILADNAEVIALLSRDAGALAFHAPLDENIKDPVKHSIAMYGVEAPISKIENYLQNSFGDDLAFERSPLHTACRDGNAGAIETLLAAGADPADKDITGLTAAELALFAHGEAGLRDFLAAFERSGRSDLAVSKGFLGEILAFPETMPPLLRVARLDAGARRLLFCYRCAWLDTEAVRAMLAEGYDPNKGLTTDINPLREVCTSAILWDGATPDGLQTAYHYTKFHGHPLASHVHFDNDLLNEDGSNFDKLFAEAERRRKAMARSVETMTLEAEAERRQIDQRIELLDILVDAGLDIALASKKLDNGFFAELRKMGLRRVAERLKQPGGARPRKPAKPAATTGWELSGETGLNVEYWPNAGAAGLIRLVLYDGYGPVDGISLSARLSLGKKSSNGEWQDLQPVTETLEIDGERVPRAQLQDPVYGETPWEASYEIALKKSDKSNMLWIRIDHAEDEFLRGELDPWKFASD